MSSGVKHEAIGSKVEALGLVGAAVAAWGFGVDERLAVCAFVGLWAGFELVTPDADFGRLTFSETRWFRDPRRDSLASLLAAVAQYQVGILVLLLGFWPGLLLGHRKISHVPVVGAAVIAALALASPLIVGLLAARDWWRLLTPQEVLAAFAGFAIAHFVHILTDKFS